LVEVAHELLDPSVLCSSQSLENGMQQEFTKVVDCLAEKSGDAEVVGAGNTVLLRQVGLDVDASEVKKGVFVVGSVICLDLKCQ
jgi:hypothetical protein